MNYNSYDELLALVAVLRAEHPNMPDDDLNKLVKKTFKIDQAALREIDGISDEFNLGQ
tara:strand:- start:9286 stop:9459 length:174 start_codon:yes stop_codon:yes gene_type:complete